MSQNPIWKMTLVRSRDMVQVGDLDESRSTTFQPFFNKPGSCTIVLSLDSQAAARVRAWSIGMIIVRRNKPIWSGMCVSVSKDGEANTMTATFIGWLDEINHRNVRANETSSMIFGGVTSGNIIKQMLTNVNAQLDTSGIVRPLHLLFGTGTDTQVRTQTSNVGDNYGTILNNLISIENGCDVTVDPLTRQINVFPPTSFYDQKKVKFGYNTYPNNLANCVEDDDSTSLVNRENVQSANGSVYSQDDATAIENAGVMLEEWISVSDISDPTIALAYANAELVYKRYGTTTYTLTPKQFGEMPRPYDDFNWGDQVYLNASKGCMSIQNQAVRIFGGTIVLDSEGNELIQQLSTSPS